MTAFRYMVDRVREIVRTEKEISTARLAYMLNTSPTRASYLLRAAAEIDDRIVYHRGRASWQDGKGGSDV